MIIASLSECKKIPNKYTLGEIQNEILKILSHNIFQLTDCLHSVLFYSLMVDDNFPRQPSNMKIRVD